MMGFALWAAVLATLSASMQQAASMWSITQSTDPATDLPIVSASVRSSSGAERLVIRCDGVGEPVVSVQFITARYLGGGEERPVTIRFDQGPPMTFDWEYTSKGVYNRDEKLVRALGNLLARSNRVLVRAYNYEEQPVDGAFLVSGGEATIRRVFAACNYQFDDTVRTERG